MNKSHTKKDQKELFKTFLLLQSEKEVQDFLSDLLTPQELEVFAERWQVVKKLLEGKSQREIAEECSVAVATVTRANRFIQYGSGGFKKIWERSQE